MNQIEGLTLEQIGRLNELKSDSSCGLEVRGFSRTTSLLVEVGGEGFYCGQWDSLPDVVVRTDLPPGRVFRLVEPVVDGVPLKTE